MKTANDNLIAQLPCGIFTFNDNGSIQFINDHFLEKLQYKLEELKGKSVESIFTLSTRIFYQTHFFPLLKMHKKAEEVFLTLLCKNKDEIPVLTNAAEQMQDGKIVNVCVAIPVPQRKKFEDEILFAKRAAEDALHKNEELQKVKQELQAEREAHDKQLTNLKNKNEELSQLNNVFAHDLQEPVRKVSVFTDVILNSKNMLNGEEARSLFNIIFRSSQRMRKLLRGIQEYLYLSVEEIKPGLVNLNQVVKDQLALLQTKYAIEANVEVEYLATVKGDASQLSILFKELLDNCFRFKSDRIPEIRVACSIITENLFSSIEGKYKYGEFARISVEDNGIGFKPDTRHHIFRIFKKVDFTSEGLGMGLAICKKIVENHGGKITAVGQEGIGSKFVVTLPTV